MAGELLLDRPADGVLRLTISNPAKRNALDHAILDAVAAVLADLGDARALVLTGADGMVLGMPPAKLGLVYSHTGLRRFLQAIGAPRTKELFLTGRNVDARTALSWGLVNA